MEDSREDDYRVPLISSLFCLCVSAGGVLLVLYVFVPSSSQSWFPIVAFILIGSPWIFWILAYIYTCIKACVRSHNNYYNNNSLQHRQISRRSINNNAAAAATAAASSSSSHNTSARKNEPANDDNGGKHVHFGGVIVHDGHENGGEDPSINSSKEIEMPFTSSV
ncbi:hypothetical protein M9H77_33637 [Catharanthus roseus]|uniref:Uncharacterized protein n=1 Tax=Catharanthus roseus TaxID=4058 RepID=A0ACB9ZJ17_CATRO|nr:hypothetical protein M9H77_33637 [Catharanthus roseus]